MWEVIASSLRMQTQSHTVHHTNNDTGLSSPATRLQQEFLITTETLKAMMEAMASHAVAEAVAH